jgi:hypothetical protein
MLIYVRADIYLGELEGGIDAIDACSEGKTFQPITK